MGQTLSSPATKKHSQSGGNDRFYFGVSEMQGWRISMEDAHAVILDLDEGQPNSNTFFAVYDGHGGGTVARFAGQNVHKRLVLEESYHQRQYDVALKKAFLGTDEDLLADPSHTRDPSGCTAVAALITSDGQVYVANAGDSRSVMSVKGEVEPLSFDHKPTGVVEKNRIHGAGGYIEYGRVNGNLALSRALGDFEFKKNYSLTPEKQIITADPDVTCHKISEEDEFLVIACDGIWDCLSSQQVVDIVRRQVAEGKELSEICEMICDHCLAPDTSSGAGIGCDNMTILIVAILNGRTTEEWYAWMKQRVNNNHGYHTPSSLPSLYSASRLMSFRARREAQERARQSSEDDRQPPPNSPFARVLTASNGISILGSGIVNDNTLMFGTEDSEEEDSGDEEQGDELNVGSSFFRQTLGLGHPDSLENPDATKNLKNQLDEYEKDIRDEDDEGETWMDATDEDRNPPKDSGADPQGEALSPQKSLPNGHASSVPEEQHKSHPSGAEPLELKAEGLMDAKEDPLLQT